MKFLKYILEKINFQSKQKKELPLHFKYILGITSLWLLYPFIYGIMDIFKNRNINILYIIITLLIGVCCVVSTLLGVNKLNSLVHLIDVKCAEILFILLCIYYRFYINNNLNILSFIFPFLVVLFFGLATYFNNIYVYELNIIFHLLFRFIGFWWCCFIFIKNINYEIFFTLSIAYFIYIMIELDCIRKQPNLKKKYKLYYGYGCIKIIIFILLCLLFNLKYNYIK